MLKASRREFLSLEKEEDFVTDLENVLDVLNDYIELMEHNNLAYAIVINSDGSGCISENAMDIQVKSYDTMFEFNTVNEMVEKLYRIHQDAQEQNKKAVLERIRADMNRCGLTLKDLAEN